MLARPLLHPPLDLGRRVIVPEVHLPIDQRLDLLVAGQRKDRSAVALPGNDQNLAGGIGAPLGPCILGRCGWSPEECSYCEDGDGETAHADVKGRRVGKESSAPRRSWPVDARRVTTGRVVKRPQTRQPDDG